MHKKILLNVESDVKSEWTTLYRFSKEFLSKAYRASIMPTRKVIADSATLRDNKEKCKRRSKLYSLIV